jgi:hypothetical protein
MQTLWWSHRFLRDQQYQNMELVKLSTVVSAANYPHGFALCYSPRLVECACIATPVLLNTFVPAPSQVCHQNIRRAAAQGVHQRVPQQSCESCAEIQAARTQSCTQRFQYTFAARLQCCPMLLATKHAVPPSAVSCQPSLPAACFQHFGIAPQPFSWCCVHSVWCGVGGIDG